MTQEEFDEVIAGVCFVIAGLCFVIAGLDPDDLEALHDEGKK